MWLEKSKRSVAECVVGIFLLLFFVDIFRLSVILICFDILSNYIFVHIFLLIYDKYPYVFRCGKEKEKKSGQ